jgi:hypothetical protein
MLDVVLGTDRYLSIACTRYLPLLSLVFLKYYGIRLQRPILQLVKHRDRDTKNGIKGPLQTMESLQSLSSRISKNSQISRQKPISMDQSKA